MFGAEIICKRAVLELLLNRTFLESNRFGTELFGNIFMFK